MCVCVWLLVGDQDKVHCHRWWWWQVLHRAGVETCDSINIYTQNEDQLRLSDPNKFTHFTASISEALKMIFQFQTQHAQVTKFGKTMDGTVV